jgi:hypothetical protein
MQRVSDGEVVPATLRADPGHQEFDVVIIGSGFGGSVSALRLTEKGYRERPLFHPLPRASFDFGRDGVDPETGLG